MPALTDRFTLNHLRHARLTGRKVPMLTCYDFLSARLMQEAGIPALLVGDSASNVILGHDSTLPISLDFLIEITRAVRRGAPLALLMADMPFGSYHESVSQGVRNVVRMIKETHCDCIKLEVSRAQLPLVKALSQMGVAIIAHLGLRPQMVGLTGGYRYQARTADEAEELVASALHFQENGAAGLLLEAVPPEAAQAVVDATEVPVIGCGAGPHCHGCVIVTPDALGMTGKPPRFVPILAKVGDAMKAAFEEYGRMAMAGEYPALEHNYEMPADEAADLAARMHRRTHADEIPF